MRVRAVELLGYLKDWSSFEPLRWLIMDRVRGSDRDRFARSAVRQAAAESMQQLWRAHVLSEQRLADYPQLYLFLRSWSAVWTLPEKASFTELERLVGWLNDQESSWLQSIAVVPISDIAIRHPNEALAHEALQSLAQAFHTLDNEDTIWTVASSAAEFSYLPAGSTSTNLMAMTMLNVLQRPAESGSGSNMHTARQEAAAYALGKLKRADALGPLCELLIDRDQDFRVQARAAKAIGECGLENPAHRDLPQARQMLIQVAGSFNKPNPWNPYARRKAIGSLGHLGGEGVVDVLLEIIRNQRGDESQRLRARATFALQQLMGREAAANLLQSEIPLRPVRGDYSRTNRLLSALALIGDERTAQALLERQWSIETVKKLDEQEWILNLRRMNARRPQALPPKFPGRNLRFLGDADPERQMKGPDVNQLEKRLWRLGYAEILSTISGRFSRDTEGAVKAFQRRSKGLSSTGVVDIPTWRRLFSNQACQGSGRLLIIDEDGSPITFQSNLSLRTVRMAGADVRLVQSYLWDLGYGELLEVIDGVFSSATQRAIMAWQTDGGFLPTGVIERTTWEELRAHWERNDKLNVRPGRLCP
jgi:peptidoglycan hydrolase-like protein with peptidoglycan-binding domain